MKIFNKYFKYSFIIIFILTIDSTFSQNMKENKMKDLSYMIGEWIGISTVYKNGVVDKQVPAFEKIKYDLDNTIIVIDLNSEVLQLHTIIYYDDKENTYYYNPYSKSGSRRLPAKYKDGRFTVTASETSRFIFTTDEEGNFKEYGEQLVDGKWIKTFEDRFKKSK